VGGIPEALTHRQRNSTSMEIVRTPDNYTPRGGNGGGNCRVAGEGGRGGWRAWLGGTNLLVHCVAEQLNAPNLDKLLGIDLKSAVLEERSGGQTRLCIDPRYADTL